MWLFCSSFRRCLPCRPANVHPQSLCNCTSQCLQRANLDPYSRPQSRIARPSANTYQNTPQISGKPSKKKNTYQTPTKHLPNTHQTPQRKKEHMLQASRLGDLPRGRPTGAVQAVALPAEGDGTQVHVAQVLLATLLYRFGLIRTSEKKGKTAMWKTLPI